MALLYKIPLTADMKALWKIPLFKYNLVDSLDLDLYCSSPQPSNLQNKKEKMEVPESWSQKSKRTVLNFK